MQIQAAQILFNFLEIVVHGDGRLEPFRESCNRSLPHFCGFDFVGFGGGKWSVGTHEVSKGGTGVELVVELCGGTLRFGGWEDSVGIGGCGKSSCAVI